MTRLQEWRVRSRESLAQMWGHGLDILEYQDATLIRDRAAQPQWAGLRQTLAFVLLAALLNSFIALAAGVLAGTAVESWVRSILNFMTTFVVNTGVAFALGRLLGGKASLRQYVHVSALYAVPLQVVEALLTVVSSLLPIIGFYVLFALSLAWVFVWLYFSNLVTQAMMQFPQRWQRVAMFLVLLVLAVLKGGFSVLG